MARGARPGVDLERRFAEAEVGTGDAIVALSGGSDSVALCALAAGVAAARGFALRAVHVHHGLRPSADQDAAVALAACARLGVPCEVRRVVCARADEATLRRERYAALEAAARARGAARVLVGHTAEDQTETVLLALFRGTGPGGLRGMPAARPLSEGVALERPLLRFERARLRRYCDRRGLAYAVDPTNVDPAYRRNRLRGTLAQLRPHFPGLDRAVARCAAIAGEERTRTAGLLHAWLVERGEARDVDAERLEAAARLLDLGAGRRLRISLEPHPSPARARS